MLENKIIYDYGYELAQQLKKQRGLSAAKTVALSFTKTPYTSNEQLFRKKILHLSIAVSVAIPIEVIAEDFTNLKVDMLSGFNNALSSNKKR